MADQQLQVVLSINDAKYSAAIERARAGIKRLQSDMRSAGHDTVSEMQASQAAVAGLEGKLLDSRRVLERFLTTIPGVSQAFAAMFPILGATAFVGIVVRMGQSIKEAVDHANNLGSSLSKGFADLNRSAQTANDELAVTNAKLDLQIEKLEHKPQNQLAVAFAEAKVEADKLDDSVRKAIGDVQSLLTQQKVGFVDQLLGKGSGKDIDDMIQGHLTDIQKKADAWRNSVAAKGADSPEASQAWQNLTSSQGAVNSDIQNEIIRRSGRGSYQMVNGQQQFVTSPNGAVSFSAAFGDQGRNLAALSGSQGRLNDLFDQLGLEHEISGKQKTVAGLEQNKSASVATYDPNSDIDKWLSTAKKKYEDFQKSQAESLSDAEKASDEVNKMFARQAEAAQRYANDLADIQRKGADSVAQQGIEFARASGQITAHAAALALADLHTRQYTQSLSDLQAQQRAADNAGDTQESQRVGRQIAELNANRQPQVGADQNAINGTTLKYQLGEFANALSDTTDKLRSLIENTINSFNDDLLSGKGFKQTATDTVKGLGKIGLEGVEGRVLNSFGIGGVGKLGTQGNPIWTRSADTGTGASIGGFKLPNLPGFGGEWGSDDDNGGGFFGGLASIFSGKGYADGGSPPVGMASIVGERGPELFVPKSAGTVVSNKKAFGGDTHHNYDFSNADFRGSNAAEIQAAIRRAAPQIVAASVKSVHERQVRRPSTAR